jgi:hypothetical protein
MSKKAGKYGAQPSQLSRHGMTQAAQLWREAFDSHNYRPRSRPRWFRRLIDKHYGGIFPYSQWLDHFGKMTDPDSGAEILIAEPYGLSSDDARELLTFCDRHKLEFSIHAMSAHFPGRTISIWIQPQRTVSELESPVLMQGWEESREVKV